MTEVIYNASLRGRIHVDEALFTHRVGSGRRGTRQVWVVGYLEERSGKAYAFVVRNRNSTTINQLIVHNILADSFIIHDGWEGTIESPTFTVITGTCMRMILIIQAESRIMGELRAFIRNIYSAGIVEGNIRIMIQETNFRRRCRTRGLSPTEEFIYILLNH